MILVKKTIVRAAEFIFIFLPTNIMPQMYNNILIYKTFLQKTTLCVVNDKWKIVIFVYI